MRIETKIGLYFIIPVAVITLLIFANIFCKQSEILHQDYTENCRRQAGSLANLSRKSVAENDLVYLNNNISMLKYQKDIIELTVLDFPGKNIIASAVNDEYLDRSRARYHNLRMDGDDIVCNEYVDTSTSKLILQVMAPILNSRKRCATLVMFFDGSRLLDQEDDLKSSLFIEGLILIAVSSLIILAAGKIIAKYYSKFLNRSNIAPPIDVFGLTELTHDTMVSVRIFTDIDSYKFSQAEKDIINIIPSCKFVRHILKESQFDEVLTFELISRLVNRGILEIRQINEGKVGVT